MRALIDGDILAYECGGLRKQGDSQDFCPELEEGDYLPFELCFASVENKIDNIVKATNADTYTVYLSCPSDKSWRYKEATIRPYKENRSTYEKPPHWEAIRTNLELHHPCIIAKGIEADDAMSIAQYEDLEKVKASDIVNIICFSTVICSRDKDLDMVPGWHYSWPTGKSPEKPMWWQDEINGLRCFYKQLLTGDRTDNIPGLFGVGEKSAAVKALAEFTTEQEMFNHVYKQYQDRLGSYAALFMRENGMLLWMQETMEDRWDRSSELMEGYVYG